MTLSSGIRLGRYEVLDAIGAGGMGEVYRARDTRLERTVAIKILHARLSADPNRQRRFEREAKTISNLNHPHICVLHDVGSHEGINYLVMEWVDGETLSSRLMRGPLPLDQVLRLGAQIADALDKAHRCGIIHRDLKPGNIMLTSSGVKLLDFGLAKTTPLDSGATATEPVSETTPVTEQGVVVGTYQYMSPEQIEGKELDHRSDIFSLGSVLYEMQTGQPAFDGKSQLSVASAILVREPKPISSVRPATPPTLDHAIRRCLEKEPEKRWQSAADLGGELQWLADSGSHAGIWTSLAHSKKRWNVGYLAATGLVLGLIMALAWSRSMPVPRATMPIRLSAQLAAGSFIDRFRGAYLAVSPDGTRIVVSESDALRKRHLAMRSLDQTQFVTLPHTDNALNAFFSPDGEWVGFYSSSEHKLKKIAVGGGEPITLCDLPMVVAGASWGDDGNIVAALMGDSPGLVRIPSRGGAPVAIAQVNKEKGETAYTWPQVLPGSSEILFTIYRNQLYPTHESEVDILSLKTGERKNIQRGGFFGRYLPTGHLAYMQENSLYVSPFDLKRKAMTGTARPILEEVNSTPLGHADFDLSQNGTLAYVNSSGLSHNEILWLENPGETKALKAKPDVYQNPRFSPDGKRLAFDISRSPTQADIWVMDLERESMSRVTHLPGVNRAPLWTPDGRSIVFTSFLQEAPGLYVTRADGASDAERLTDDSKIVKVPRSFSADGKWLAYYQYQNFTYGKPQIRIASVEPNSDHLRLGEGEAFTHSSFSEINPAFSPNGRWLAYSSDDSGVQELYVRPFPGPGGKTDVSVGGGNFPVWSRDGRKLYFLTPDLRIMVADCDVRGESFVAQRPRAWSARNLMFLGNNYPYDLAQDGKRFAVMMSSGTATDQADRPTDSVTVLLNFFDELRRRVPADKN